MVIKEELTEIFIGVFDYLVKAFMYVKPILIFLSSVASYLLFPDEAYVTPAIGLSIALLLDIVSKYYSISVKSGGFFKAIKNKKITSDSLWRGTKKKIVSVLAVMIICGLTIRFTPFYPQIAIVIASVAYFVMFYREVQSILENLIDAGHDDLEFLLKLVKRKKKEVLDENIEVIEESNDSPKI